MSRHAGGLAVAASGVSRRGADRRVPGIVRVIEMSATIARFDATRTPDDAYSNALFSSL